MILEQHNRVAAVGGTVERKGAIRRVQFHTLGVVCEIQYVPPGQDQAERFARTAVKWMDEFESKYSRFRPASLIGRINAAAGRDWVAIDADAERMFSLADQIHLLTRGIVDPTVLPLRRLWTCTPEQFRLPTSDEIRAALAKVGWKRVRREPGRVYLPEAGMGLDFEVICKRYAIDRLIEIAERHDITNVMIDFGRDVRAQGAPPGAPFWTVGLEDPLRPGVPRACLAITSAGVATAGDFARFFSLGGKAFGHVIDPTTGHPVNNDCHTATVVARTCLEAGVLATTAYVLGAEEGLRLIENFPGAEGTISCQGRELQTRRYCHHVA